jgi:plastocyanin
MSRSLFDVIGTVALLAGLAGSAAAQAAPRVVITPSTRTVVAGDTVRYTAQLVDEAG